MAKAVRTPAFRMQVVPDKRKKGPKHKPHDEQNLNLGDAENSSKNVDDEKQE
ncbi:MAG: hypothetical protein HY850_03295 [Betaproteobacteria bacterium]|nr:hypothetical protein [Betaproteobacteria bacterium]